MRRFTKMFMIGLVLCLFQTAIHAQATTGALRGTVTDATGSVVANASVKIKNESTGIESTLTSGGDGAFSISSLLPGTYTITTEVTGFKRSVKTGLKVGVGVVTSADVSLEAGTVSETVTVTASGDEALQTDQSQISGTLEARKVQDLPSNGAGGGIDTLALLIPGVIANRVGGTNTNGTGLSVNGNRGRSNNFQIDGSDNNDLSVGGPALFVDFQDAVQEFQVITSNFDARYGRNQGAIVNIVTRSGSNQFHGSVFWHHQDAKVLNSLDNITRAAGITENDPNLWNVFGGTVGGPVYLPYFGEGTPAVWKGTDRAFFFFSYQGIRNPASFTSRSTSLGVFATDFARLQSTYPGNAVMSTIANFSPWAIPGANLNSTIPGTVTGAQINTNAAAGCPRAIAVGATPPAGCTGYTTPNNPSTGQPFLIGGPYDILNFGTNAAPSLFQAAQYERTRGVAFNEDYWSFRFDVKATSKDNITFRYLDQQAASENGVGTISSGFNGDVPVYSRNYGGTWTRSFTNRLLNDLRLNYQVIGVEFGGGCEASAPGCIPSPSAIDVAFANISFSAALGLTKANAMPTIGPATNLPQGRVGKVYQVADNLTWATGKHQFTFGYEYKYLDTIVPFLPNYNGTFAYSNNITGLPAGSSPASRITNNAPSGVSIVEGNPLLPFIEKDNYFFVQDDWRVLQNLTLNLGVRYENTGQPINVLNDVTTARESSSHPLFNPALPLADRVVPRVPVDTNNWAPRLGFAWTPQFWKGFFGENKTVFRGGYSIAFDPAFYNILLNVASAAPAAAALTIPAASLPAVGNPSPLPTNPFGNVVRAAAAASGQLPVGVLNPIYLAQTKVGTDFRAPFARQFSFGMQRQLGTKHIFEVRYVGTQGRDLFQNINDNFFIRPLVSGFTRSSIATPGFPSVAIVFPGFASLLPAGTTAQTCVDVVGTLDNEAACDGRQFRAAGITNRKNTSNSDYHSLQARYNGRLLNDSLTLGASYTFSKTTDDASEIFNFDGASVNAQNPFCINSCEKALSNLHRPHAFSVNFVYDIPFFKEQQGWVGHLLGGWQINGVYILTSGQAYSANDTLTSGLGLGNTYLTLGYRPFYGNPNAPIDSVGISQIDANFLFGAPLISQTGFYSMASINQNGAAGATVVTPNDVRFILNGPGAAKIFGTPFGDVSRNILRGPIFNNLNLSVFKNIKVYERLRVQLRGEFFNALNHPNPGFGVASGGSLPQTNIGNAGVASNGFANFDDIALANRVIQVGIRVVF